MKTVFNRTKTKAWIKRAHKDKLLAYGHGYITDGRVLLAEEQHMQPAILELFGTLAPACKYSAEVFREMMSLPDKPVKVIDSQLEFVLDSKFRLRIFYDPRTGKDLTIDGKYFDLIENPKVLEYYTNDSMDRLWITYGEDVVGLFAPFRLRNRLHVRFEAKEGDE